MIFWWSGKPIGSLADAKGVGLEFRSGACFISTLLCTSAPLGVVRNGKGDITDIDKVGGLDWGRRQETD